MGDLHIGSFSEGWTDLLTGEAVYESPEDGQPPLYMRGPLSPPRRTAEEAEFDNQARRVSSEATVFSAFATAAASLGMTPTETAALFAEIVTPIPEPALSVLCREDHHFAPGFPEGCCMGKRLDADYGWHRCECSCHDGQEVTLP